MVSGLKSVLGLALICFSLFVIAEATVITVGDADGWHYDIEDWPNGKSFKAGDVLVFNYEKGEHNVVIVDAVGYSSCQPAPGSKGYVWGNDRITLVKGPNYFICSFPRHCEDGMKMAVNAA